MNTSRATQCCLAFMIFWNIFAHAVEPEDKRAVNLRLKEGPYLRITPDGVGKLGFGALPECAHTPENTLDFDLLYKELSANAALKDHSEHDVAVNFERAGGRVYYLQDRKRVDELFESAKKAATRLENGSDNCPVPRKETDAVRFEPGQTRSVALIPLGGARVIYGFNGKV